ncbi:MAG TPA: hypothetical protein VMR96_08790, partial [Solirubrobacterales bacterium]|nr:hypothetical protein [Solirubrobacterales bacterium]
TMLRNVHERWFPAPPEALEPWVAKLWSGGADDAFPHDFIRSWRKNPPGVPADAVIAGVTRTGHGRFSFLVEEAGPRKVRYGVRGGLEGWHQLELIPDGQGTLVRHSLEIRRPLLKVLAFRLLILPLHDWAVEAIFDRLGEALRTGKVPGRTARQPPALYLPILRKVGAGEANRRPDVREAA